VARAESGKQADLGLRFADVQLADRRLAVVEGKGGRHRVVPAADRFFAELGNYLHGERPAAAATERVFTVLKGPRRGLPLSAEGLDEILDGARGRAGLEHAACHELRHTCLTRLRKAGMALEAVQAQAGHLSIESTRVYLHLTSDWLAGEYRRAAALTGADTAAVQGLVQVRGLRGEDLGALVDVAVRGGAGDAVVAAELLDPGAVAEPAQDQDRLLTAGQSPAPGRGAPQGPVP
jgi:hypothetical protein